MVLSIESPTLALDAGQVLTLDDAAGRRVVARSGALWITEEDSLDDLVLAPGEWVLLRRPGRTLVQALRPSQVSIQ